MFFKEGLVIEPNHIVVIDMVAEMFVSNIFKLAVAGSADPAQRFSELRIVMVLFEHGVVCAFMDKICRNDHAVTQQQCAWDEAPPACREK